MLIYRSFCGRRASFMVSFFCRRKRQKIKLKDGKDGDLNMMKVKYYTCPECKKKYKTLNGWGEHMDILHPNQRPEGFSTSRFFYFVKTGKTSGKCRTCKGPTSWNEISMKYNVFCDNPKCKEAYVKVAKQRMVNIYGKEYILDDPNVQRKMVANRKISGTYIFQDGTKFTYVGQYERKFLEMLDKMMQWPSNDIFAPSPHTYYYEYRNEKDKDHKHDGKKFYIPDFYIASLNLEIEIKQQTSTNQAFNEVNRPKEKMKDDIMRANPSINYLKLNDNNFEDFFVFLEEFQRNIPEENDSKGLLVAKESVTEALPAIEETIKNDSNGIINKWFVKGKDGCQNACVQLKGYDKPFRGRSEMIVIRGDEIFLKMNEDGTYEFPGGSWNPHEDWSDAAVRETEEEARLEVTNVLSYGFRIETLEEPKKWVKENIPKKDWWYGYYSFICVGTFCGHYGGSIREKDKDDMLYKGKFVPIKDVIPILLLEHKRAILSYMNQIADEAFVFNKDDLFYNKEKFDNGDVNLLLVIGHSGSGKTTMGHYFLDDYDQNISTDLTELDMVVYNKESYTMENLKEAGELIYAFFKGPGKKYYYTAQENIDGKVKNPIGDDYDFKIIMDFMKFAFTHAKKHPEKRFILEGVWPVIYMTPNIFDKYAVYIKGTSMLMSNVRAANRDSKWDYPEFNQILQRGKAWVTRFSCMFRGGIGTSSNSFSFEKKLNEWRAYFKNIGPVSSVHVVMESAIKEVDKIEEYYKKNDIKSGINNKGNWGLDKFKSGDSDTLFILSNPDYKKIAKDLKKIIGEGFTIKEDNYNTLFLKRKKNTIATEEAHYSKKNKYPVFIILQHSGTNMAKLIKTFTHDTYTHVCIAFNPELSPIYSFGRKENLKDTGFVIQSGPNDPFYQRHQTMYSTYVMYVDKESYKKILERLDFFIKRDKEKPYGFDQIGLVKIFLGKESTRDDRYFCSKFVMSLIGEAHPLDRHPSLYKPQDIGDLEDISLVNKGTDFKQYDVSTTMKNLKRVQQGKFDEIATEALYFFSNEIVNESSTSNNSEQGNYYAIPDYGKISRMESEYVSDMFGYPIKFHGTQADLSGRDEENTHIYAMEGILSFLTGKKNKGEEVENWATQLFGVRNLKGCLGKIGAGIKVTDNQIEIRGINYSLLKNRILKFYDDKSIFNIFLPKYNALSYRRFERKKIQRADIKIDYIHTEAFFALELVRLFTDLGTRFRDKNYKSMARIIYQNSWLSVADSKAERTDFLDTSHLTNLKFTLNDYQIDFIQKYPKLKAQLNLNGYILAFEQGLGKTLTAVGLSECLNVDHLYIVCPNSLKENWALELRKYYKKYEEDEDLWRQEVFICSDKPIYFDPNTTRFLIINNESIEKMFPYVMSGKNMLVLDESHNFRNVNSKRVQQLIQLRDRLRCTDTLIMSGTPIKATPDEIVPALLMIDPTFTMEAATLFSKAFKLHSSLGTSLVQTRFGKIMYRKEKDVLEGKLPEKFIENLPLKISDSDKYLMSSVKEKVNQRFSAIYDAGLNEMKQLEKPFFELSKKYNRTEDYKRFCDIMKIFIKKDEYPHEIDQMYVEKYMKLIKENIKDKKERDYYDFLIKNYVRYKAHCLGLAFGEIMPPYRRDMFNALYDENRDFIHKKIKENIKKSLIFSQFKGVATHICTDLNEHGIGAVLITGDVKNRMEILKEFKENDNVLVLVATSQTIGTGVTLVEANQMFFFGPPWRDADFEQCSDRIHRIGQTDDCYVYTVTLDTGDQLNLSTRMDNILNWSKEMTSSVIIKTDDTEDIDETDFSQLLKAQESSMISEFLSEPEFHQLKVRDIIAKESFNDYFFEKEDYLTRDYVAIRPIKADVIVQENAIIKIPGQEPRRTLLAKELMNYPTTNANVVLERYYDNGITYWNVVTTKDIAPGEVLVYGV